jgi:hypothetical protein
MIGNIDIYQILNRLGINFALILIIILLMYFAFWKNPSSAHSSQRRFRHA